MLLPLPERCRSALVIVDMQEFFFKKPERRKGLDEVIKNINRLIRVFEDHHYPIFHIITAYRPDGSDWELKMKVSGKAELIIGSPETVILPAINVSSSHTILIKTRYSAFFKTDLVDRLIAEEISQVVVAGGYTHYCINATIFDAYCYDYVPCLIIDGVISHLKDESEVLIDRMKRNGYHILSTDEFLAKS
jgi:NAD+ synthase